MGKSVYSPGSVTDICARKYTLLEGESFLFTLKSVSSITDFLILAILHEPFHVDESDSFYGN